MKKMKRKYLNFGKNHPKLLVSDPKTKTNFGWSLLPSFILETTATVYWSLFPDKLSKPAPERHNHSGF